MSLSHRRPATARPVSVARDAQSLAPPPPARDETIETVGRHQRLRATVAVGGRLGLSLQHSPATIDIIQRSVMLERGYTHAEDAADSAPGVSSGGSPGNPAQLLMRGFTGDQILMLRDGIYYGPTTTVNRPQNTFNLESLQIIKGPSSVIYGQGAVGGTVDMTTRDPALDAAHANALVSYGSFNTWNAGIGGSLPLTKTLAIRADFSRTSSDGYVKGADPHSNDLTVALLWKPSNTFTARLGMDYLTDQLSTYYGTPLVPTAQTGPPAHGLLQSTQGLGVARASLWRYYNVRDPRAASTNATPTLRLSWQPRSDMAFTNKSYFVYAKRRWDNAEAYTYIGGPGSADASGNPIAPGRIGRDRFYVYQNQHQVGDTLYGQFDQHLGSIRNRVVVGGDAYYIRFIRNRGFPDASYADSVSLVSPEGGALGAFSGELPYRKSPTTLRDAAVFFEDVLTFHDNLRLVSGYRYDWLYLDRQNYAQNGAFLPGSSFTGHYNPSNFRIGPVWDLAPNLSLYGTFTTAEDPPGSSLFLANRGQFTRLARTRQGEIGLKGSFWQDRVTTTLALYDIRRSHILVATGPDTVAQGGAQVSRGIELQSDLTPMHNFRISGNVAYTYSRYRNFFPYAGVNASNNQVPDVPSVTTNLWGTWSHVAGLPADLGAGLRYVSQRKGDYANTLTLDRYALANVFAAWHFQKHVTVYGRIDNLANKHYIQWADVSYPSEVLLGAPRSFSISVQAGF